MSKKITVEQAIEEGWYSPNTNDGYCYCGCGEKTSISNRTVKSSGIIIGRSKKYVKGHKAPPNKEAFNLIGKRFGRLLVVKRVANRGKETVWQCVCDCGTIKEVYAGNLMRLKSTSCGCKTKETKNKCKNGHLRTPKNTYMYKGISRCRICASIHKKLPKSKEMARKNYHKVGGKADRRREKMAQKYDKMVEEMIEQYPFLQEVLDGIQV